MRLQRIFGILFLVLGLLLFLTPGTLAPVCPMKPDGSFMKCHWMDVAEQSTAAVCWRLFDPRLSAVASPP